MFDPMNFDALKIWGDLARIGLESQVVIGLRTAGMIGLIDTPKGETTRMVVEKQQAAMASIRGATRAAMRGHDAGRILDAAIRPYGHRTSANTRRLMRTALH